MSDAASSSRSAPGRKIAIGLLRLTDSAPAVVAYEFGFFADESLDVALSVEPSWANVADKLAYGALDAAIIVPPLAFAISLGLRGPAEPLIVPYSMSLGGDTITLAKGLADELRDEARGVGYAAAFAARLKASTNGKTLAIVHDYSNHNLALRYWLAAAGALAERDFGVVVTPPARMVEALRSGKIAGFCAGAPWGDIAERAGVGATVATSGRRLAERSGQGPRHARAVERGKPEGARRPSARAPSRRAVLRRARQRDLCRLAALPAGVARGRQPRHSVVAAGDCRAQPIAVP